MQLPLAKNIKRYFSLKNAVIILLVVVAASVIAAGVFFGLRKSVYIYCDGKSTTFKTMKTTVKDALSQAGISVNSYDYISLPLDSRLQRKNVNNIFIKYAVPVNLIVDGQTITLMTYRETIGDILENEGIELSDSDLIANGITTEDAVSKDMEIKVVRVEQEIELEQIAIPYGVDKVANNRLDSGTEKVVREGKEGIQEKLYKVVFEDGIEIARSLLRDAIVSNPVNALIEYGTVRTYKPARGDSFRYKEVLDMKATAYNALGCAPIDSPYFGFTASGMRAQKGVIAVDPRVIPLGTRVYVEVAGNTPDYGFAVAGDTGGAIKGNIVDLYFDTYDEAWNFGLKRVKVYILSD